MSVRATSELIVEDGSPSRIFPQGDHVFPADLDALLPLTSALRLDLAETHDVPLADLAKVQQSSEEVSEEDVERFGSFSLVHLRRFIDERRDALERALDRKTVGANTAAYFEARLEYLRALGAPDEIVEHAEREAQHASSPSFSPRLDIDGLLPRVGTSALCVDIESRRSSPDPNYPLVVASDISTIVLLALQTCVTPNALALEDATVEALAWTSLLDLQADDDAVPADVLRVRASIYLDHLEALAFTDVRANEAFRELAPSGALLRVVSCGEADE